MMKSLNPVLKDITDYLIEEGSAEEDEYEGSQRNNDNDSNDKDKDNEANDDSAPTIERDEELNRVLDRLLLYIRIVHSVDFYNCSDYPLEDEMPNRCGIVHVRGSAPPHKVTAEDGKSGLFRSTVGLLSADNSFVALLVFRRLQCSRKLLGEQMLLGGRRS